MEYFLKPNLMLTNDTLKERQDNPFLFTLGGTSHTIKKNQYDNKKGIQNLEWLLMNEGNSNNKIEIQLYYYDDHHISYVYIS